MQIQFATKRIDGQYEVALFIDDKFQRSATGTDMLALFQKLVGPVVRGFEAEGVEIGVSIGMLTAAEAARLEARMARQRQTNEANAEAEEIEKLTAAVAREKAARDAGEKAASGQ